MPTQREKAEALRALHKPGQPLVLINAWDAVTARIIESLGFPAVATTSAGVAFAQGYADGERISREEMLDCVRCIARVVSAPVTADLEAAYGPSEQDAGATARGAIQAGAAGLNFEDADGKGGLVEAAVHVARVQAMRAAGDDLGVPLVINARTDAFLLDLGDSDDWRFEESVRRANLYLEAGAASAFVPGVTDEATIAKLAKAINGPLNILAGADAPSVQRMGELGVARISTGSGSTSYAMAHFRQMAHDVRQNGSFSFAAERIPYAELNALFSQ